MASTTTPEPRRPRARRTRSVVAGALVCVIALLAPVTLVARFADKEITETDRYLATVGPLAENPVVQSAVIRRVTAEIVKVLDLDHVTEQALAALRDRSAPDVAVQSLRALSVPLASAVEQYVRDTVTQLVHSRAFADAWRAANEVAHTRLVALVTGRDAAELEVDRGTVSVDLAAVIATARQLLLDSGFELAERIPAIRADLVILRSDELTRAQWAVRLLDRVAAWLPFVILVLLALALLLAQRPRRVLVATALAVATTTLLVGVGLDVGRSAYLDAIPVGADGADAAGEVFDTLTWFLRRSVRITVLVCLAVALAAWAVGNVRLPATSGRVGDLVAARLVALRWVVLAAAAAWYVVSERPSAAQVLLALGLVLLGLALLEVLARHAPVRRSLTPAG